MMGAFGLAIHNAIRARTAFALVAALAGGVMLSGCASVVNVVPDQGFRACLNDYLRHPLFGTSTAPISAGQLATLNPSGGVSCEMRHFIGTDASAIV